MVLLILARLGAYMSSALLSSGRWAAQVPRLVDACVMCLAYPFSGGRQHTSASSTPVILRLLLTLTSPAALLLTRAAVTAKSCCHQPQAIAVHRCTPVLEAPLLLTRHLITSGGIGGGSRALLPCLCGLLRQAALPKPWRQAVSGFKGSTTACSFHLYRVMADDTVALLSLSTMAGVFALKTRHCASLSAQSSFLPVTFGERQQGSWCGMSWHGSRYPRQSWIRCRRWWFERRWRRFCSSRT